MEPLLKVRQVCKQFPGVLALDHVDFDLAPGEVHALLGENGAGKSTLVKIITGAYRLDSGTISIDGKEVRFHGPVDSREAGIGVIYQEFSLVNTLSVAENIFLGDYPMRRGRIDWKAMNEAAAELLQRFAVNAHPEDILTSLGVATRQMVEILKVLNRKNLKILIMDEPTSSLTDTEARTLFGFIRKLREQGVSVIYISHRLDEIKQICDRVTVFRNGQKISTEPAHDLSVADIVTKMLGAELAEHYPPKSKATGAPGLQVEHLSGPGFEDVSFVARQGEVLGITGLVGAGKSELVETIFGARRHTGGTVMMGDVKVDPKSPRSAVANRIGLLPESRKEQGLVLGLSCAQNITLASLDKISRPFLALGEEMRLASEKFETLEVRPGDPQNAAVNLSGGNQQKVVLAKWLTRDCRVLLFDEPTRGIDVGAKFQIYAMIVQLAEAGNTVIVSSSEIEEICGICNRTLVMRNGRIVADLAGDELTKEDILAAISRGEK
ncbi:sugar ABC transporter ATP-binding protein [Frigidibacter sp. ROC022]|uniref:sugar ABC transporter ATP-binding protein n=1 Tax=Frigidibacter sp. ROC022 TaxID=2971796 RepID=UPI00215B1FA7|nr:sugar ABC transporter ATP-binding protein [Frigidibacter sp. ROC022]MCR8725797.1 sugar ABC transporter ATP-binding protein [Frigidibacter sp. ROC022]